MANLYLGLSGYDYKEWQGEGLFYPPTVKRTGFLTYYASRMNSLESIGTFQRMPSETTIARWIASTPAEFTISPRMVQSATHYKRLSGDATAIAQRFLTALEPLERIGKLGPVPIQLPTNLKRNDKLLRDFLDAMPTRPTLRWAVEFRHESWNAPEVEAILMDRSVAWMAVETDDEAPQMRDTADFFFARLRRLQYTDDQLQGWAAVISGKLAEGKHCYVYCRHLDTVAPWTWADRLREFVGSN